MKSLLLFCMVLLGTIVYSQEEPKRFDFENTTLIVDSDTLQNKTVSIFVYQDHYVIKAHVYSFRVFYDKSLKSNTGYKFYSDSASLILRDNNFIFTNKQNKAYN